MSEGREQCHLTWNLRQFTTQWSLFDFTYWRLNRNSVKLKHLPSRNWAKSPSHSVRYWLMHPFNPYSCSFSPVGSPLCLYAFRGGFCIPHSHFLSGAVIRQSCPHHPEGLLALKGSGKNFMTVPRLYIKVSFIYGEERGLAGQHCYALGLWRICSHIRSSVAGLFVLQC